MYRIDNDYLEKVGFSPNIPEELKEDLKKNITKDVETSIILKLGEDAITPQMEMELETLNDLEGARKYLATYYPGYSNTEEYRKFFDTLPGEEKLNADKSYALLSWYQKNIPEYFEILGETLTEVTDKLMKRNGLAE